MNKVLLYYKNPRIFLKDFLWKFSKYIKNDRLYIRLKYWVMMGSLPDLKKPEAFTEKLQWIKLYDRKPIYHDMVDKVEMKKFVADRIGLMYTIPTIGVWDNFDDIDFEEDIIMVNGEYDWRSIEKRLIEMTKIQDKTFEAFPFPKKDIKNR